VAAVGFGGGRGIRWRWVDSVEVVDSVEDARPEALAVVGHPNFGGGGGAGLNFGGGERPDFGGGAGWFAA